MTTGILAPERTGETGGAAGFAQALRAEWTKFRTVRGWLAGLIVAVAVTAGIGLFGVRSGVQCGPRESGAACLPHYPLGPGGEAVKAGFYFVHRPLGRDGSVTARLTSLAGRYAGGAGPAGAALGGMRPGLQPWSKAGVIVAASMKPGAPYAAVLVTGGHGVRFQYDYTQDAAGLPGKVSAAAPRWLRLTRSGGTITGYDSADGRHWTAIGAAHLPGLPATVAAGLFATSPAYVHVSQVFGGTTGSVGPSLATGVFDHVSLTGGLEGRPGGAWAATGVGTEEAGGSLHRSGGTFAVTGSGDLAPLVGGPAGTEPAGTIEDHLAGTFAGLIALVVVAALFVTAEYRRGLLRTTLAATPRRGRVLAAKATVTGSAAFAAGLAAAAITVPVGVMLSRAEGLYVLPVSWLTGLRVIAGTAALLAVAAVLAVAVGTIVRRSAVAVAAVIVGIVLPYVLGVAQVLPLGAAEWLLRVTPAAAFAIQQSIPQYPQVTAQYTPPVYFPLPPWAGFAVLCGYAAAALAMAWYLLRRRDA